MKRKLFSLIAIATLTTTAWADISTKQLEAYMKKSGADVVLKKAQEQVVTGMQMKAKMRGSEIPKELLTKVKNVVSKKENLAKFTQGIKSLDEKDYNKIMKFYNTKLGQKNAELVRNMDIQSMRTEIAEFSKKALPKERELLISKLIELTMSEKKSEKMARVVMQSTLEALPKEIQERMKEKMDAQLAQMKPMMKQQVKASTIYTYKDYSNKEIQSLIDYYKTAFGQAETTAMIKGSTEYIKSIMSEMIQEMMKMKQKKSK